jgi:SAM-dependent methyltransferase
MPDINDFEYQKEHWREVFLTDKDASSGWRDTNKDIAIRSFFDDFFNGGTIVELGCYDGYHIPWFARADKIICVEVFEESFDYIKDKFSDIEQEIVYYKTHGNELSGIPSDSVDFIFARNCINRMSLDNVKSYVLDFKRVLRSGGRFIANVAHSSQVTSFNKAPVDVPYKFTEEDLTSIFDWANLLITGDSYFDNYGLMRNIPFSLNWGIFVVGEVK